MKESAAPLDGRTRPGPIARELFQKNRPSLVYAWIVAQGSLCLSNILALSFSSSGKDTSLSVGPRCSPLWKGARLLDGPIGLNVSITDVSAGDIQILTGEEPRVSAKEIDQRLP